MHLTAESQVPGERDEAEALNLCLEALAADGRVAYPNGVEPAPRKRGTPITAYNGEGGVRELAALNRTVEKTPLKVPIGAAFPPDEVAEAHRKVGEHVLGKVVLRVH